MRHRAAIAATPRLASPMNAHEVILLLLLQVCHPDRRGWLTAARTSAAFAGVGSAADARLYHAFVPQLRDKDLSSSAHTHNPPPDAQRPPAGPSQAREPAATARVHDDARLPFPPARKLHVRREHRVAAVVIDGRHRRTRSYHSQSSCGHGRGPQRASPGSKVQSSP